MKAPANQRGVALLAAILLVALGTILAAGIAFQSAMAARRGAASLSFDESVLVAQGAEALAAYALNQDTNNTDSQADPWAQPLGPVEITPGVMLAASIEDLQGRFNLNSLIANDGTPTGTVDPDAVLAFQRLLEMVGLEAKWADEIADWIDRDDTPQPDGLEDSGTTSQDPPYRVANTFITSTSELLALPGFGRERFLKLAPYVVALPVDAAINVCSASPALLDAMTGPSAEEYTRKTTLVEDRQKGCSPTLQDYTGVVNTGPDQGKPELVRRLSRFSMQSKYFRLTTFVTIGGSEFTLYSLLKREAAGPSGPAKVRVLQRSFTPD